MVAVVKVSEALGDASGEGGVVWVLQRVSLEMRFGGSGRAHGRYSCGGMRDLSSKNIATCGEEEMVGCWGSSC